MDALMKSQAFFAYEYDGVSHDCGDKMGWLKANVTLGLKHPDLSKPFADFLKGL